MEQKQKPKKTVTKLSLLSLGVWSALVSMSLMADTPPITDVQQIQNAIVNDVGQAQVEANAKAWGLSVEDYQRYLWLMQNTPSQHWYKDLDPAEVLALNAEKPSEMLEYAKIQARNMHVRVTRELAFNKLYPEAYKALYPDEKPIASSDIRPDSTLQAGDRVWLFVGVDTPLGRFAYEHLIKTVEATPGVILDIYFVGDNVSQQAIQSWAENMNIPHEIVNKLVTLNFGNARFKNVTTGQKASLPFIGIVHNDHFQPVTLSSVL
ncbi:MAG: TIGR03759 family integrating conjugative element protein [Gammaproteobacteria bacterium]|nr:TIGR03759 family integrating conjugative element protein [Gammaproteobacteria bacterium]MBY0544845.1 TIGR03759 family integrating conjugative element protein [Gammaproteobacteria bacterium]